MNIVILDGYTENPGDLSWEALEQLGKVTLYDRSPSEDLEEIKARIGDNEIVISNKTLLGKEVLESAPNIKYIGLLSTGYNVVDLETASKKGIPVCNIPSYGTEAVAQCTMALLLEISNRVGHHSQAVAEGRWTSCPDFCFWDFPLMELQRKTMGIIGFGRIGKATANMAQSFGMRVIVHAPREKPEFKEEPYEFVTLDQLYAQSDVISLHCPLTDDNKEMIQASSIAKMKEGVILLNTSRGGLICEQDLADALNTGKVYAAGVDVVSKEPILKENPLLTAKNCIITPHIAWASKESRQRLMDFAVGNVKAFLEGNPIHVVNKL